MSPKGLRLSALIAAMALVGYALARIPTGLTHGYAWSDMDWNLDGFTSPSELIAAGDIRMRWTEHGDLRCKEYFSFKDGLPLRTICHLKESAVAPRDEAARPK